MTHLAQATQDATSLEIDSLLGAVEGEHIEFKEARSSFPFDKLAQYCCALANEGGGKLVLGVTDRRPRDVVGTTEYSQIEQTRRSLMDKIPVRIDIRELTHEDKRILVFDVPPRPIGTPLKYKGIYWARQADSLVAMDENRLRGIFAESGSDFSSEVCVRANLTDLDGASIEDFRERWIEKSSNQRLAALTQEQLLSDADLLVDGCVTYAALILFGTQKALGRHLAQCEVVFEYRSSDGTGPAQQRKEYRQGFFTFYEDLWRTINLRNDIQHYQSGLFVIDIPTFAERPVREAIMNAVSHRDYQLNGSVFIRQYPRRLVLDSPGGLPVGITLTNILDRQSPRNRLVAEAFAKCGLVERSGQGLNLMFEESIQHGKSLPDFSGTDDYNVTLTLSGEMNDPSFVQFLEKVGQETRSLFTTHDFLVLNYIRRELSVPQPLQARLKVLLERGVIESVGRGRGVKYILSQRFHTSVGQRGAYTRTRGLGEAENRALILHHLRECGDEGCPILELQQVLPSRSRDQIKRLLGALRAEGRVRLEGQRRGARWHFVKPRLPQRREPAGQS